MWRQLCLDFTCNLVRWPSSLAGGRGGAKKASFATLPPEFWRTRSPGKATRHAMISFTLISYLSHRHASRMVQGVPPVEGNSIYRWVFLYNILTSQRWNYTVARGPEIKSLIFRHHFTLVDSGQKTAWWSKPRALITKSLHSLRWYGFLEYNGDLATGYNVTITDV